MMAVANMDAAFYAGITMLLMFMKCLEVFECTMVANLTISTVTSGFFQIVNFIFIFVVHLFGEATAAHLVFGSDVEEFSSIQGSVFTLLKFLNGSFLYDKMQAVSPKFAAVFIFYFLIVHWLLLLNIFLALIKGQFFEQQKNLQAHGLNWNDGVYRVI
jgi:hypothetical protein